MGRKSHGAFIKIRMSRRGAGKTKSMTLIWADECRSPAGTPPDPDIWCRHTTDAWQPADELQTYTDDPANAYYDGAGHLVLTAIRQSDRYTSARLNARMAGRPGAIRYGYAEARLRVPGGDGAWPAWWLLGPDDEYGWPECGEIDIMEAPASRATGGQAHQGTHSPSVAGRGDIGVGVAPTTGNWGDAFHLYAVDWKPGRLEFFIDSVPTGAVTRDDVVSRGGRWVFDDYPQFPVLSLAVGGWAGRPADAWTEQSMIVDWVRVYDRPPQAT